MAKPWYGGRHGAIRLYSLGEPIQRRGGAGSLACQMGDLRRVRFVAIKAPLLLVSCGFTLIFCQRVQQILENFIDINLF